MSDEEFAVAYEKASAELDGILNRLKRYSDEYQESRPFTIDFVEIKKLKSLGEFLEAFPMQFIPKTITLADDSEEFLQTFKDDYDTYPSRSFVDKYMSSWREKVDGLTTKIENKLGKKAAKFDLVINSWMSVRMDLTKEVRGSNGAAILYAIEWYGATGCRSDAPYPEKPERLGQGESYHPGANYESQVGWISHSTPQVKGMQSTQPDKLWKRLGSWTLPFSNGFIVQTKKGYSDKGVSLT